MSYLQAFVIAVIQGVTELFPVSSLGHSVLIPAWLGGSWQTMVTQSSQASSETSFYLAYIVARLGPDHPRTGRQPASRAARTPAQHPGAR